MIPSSTCAADTPCCLELHSIANHLLVETYDAVMACYPGVECCPPLSAYVTLGEGDDGIVDSLTVSIRSIASSVNTRPGQLGLWRATFAIRLSESGWPTARREGTAILMPEPEAQAVAIRHVLSMGEAIHKRLSNLQTRRGLVPDGIRCSNASLGGMTPVGPRGGVAGWLVPVTVDLPWN